MEENGDDDHDDGGVILALACMAGRYHVDDEKRGYENLEVIKEKDFLCFQRVTLVTLLLFM